MLRQEIDDKLVPYGMNPIWIIVLYKCKSWEKSGFHWNAPELSFHFIDSGSKLQWKVYKKTFDKRLRQKSKQTSVIFTHIYSPRIRVATNTHVSDNYNKIFTVIWFLLFCYRNNDNNCALAQPKQTNNYHNQFDNKSKRKERTRTFWRIKVDTNAAHTFSICVCISIYLIFKWVLQIFVFKKIAFLN